MHDALMMRLAERVAKLQCNLQEVSDFIGRGREIIRQGAKRKRRVDQRIAVEITGGARRGDGPAGRKISGQRSLIFQPLRRLKRDVVTLSGGDYQRLT